MAWAAFCRRLEQRKVWGREASGAEDKLGLPHRFPQGAYFLRIDYFLIAHRKKHTFKFTQTFYHQVWGQRPCFDSLYGELVQAANSGIRAPNLSSVIDFGAFRSVLKNTSTQNESWFICFQKLVSTQLGYGREGEEYYKIKQICGVDIPKQEKERVKFLLPFTSTQGSLFLTNLELVIIQ